VAQTTRLLRRIEAGDRQAGEELLEVVYGELRELAGSYMSVERAGHTLEPTALVHEAWLRLMGAEPLEWSGRAHFVGLAAIAMRRVLIDHARRRQAEKRGGASRRESLELLVDSFEARSADLVALGEALERLEAMDPGLARIVERRFFGGATNAEVAADLGLSERTVERGWRTARAWLRAELGPETEAGS
jgi:RNA polymerase sigma factor (TIGR02999 family)